MAGNSLGSIAVLCVDDDPEFADVAAAFLERQNEEFVVETATSAVEGEKRLADGEFDCIVSDYDMPERDGIQFLESVRTNHPDIPFVLYTGKGSEEVASEAISAGITDYLQKASGTDQYAVLANRIKNAVERYRSQQALSEQNRALRRYERMINSMHESACIYNADGCFEIVNEYLAEWYGTTREELEGQESNLIALLRSGVDNDPYQELLDGERAELRGEFDGEFPGHGYAVVEYYLTPLSVDGCIEGVVGVARDITERKQYEQRLEALNRATSALITVDTQEGVADIGVEVARETLGLEASAIHLYDESRSVLEPVAVSDAVYDLVGEPPTFTEGDSIAWRVYDASEALAVDEVDADPDAYNDQTEVQSELFLPLGKYGILIAGSATAEAFDRQDVVLGEILAGNITSAFEQVERAEQLRVRRQELTRQNERLEEFTSVVSHDLRNPLNVAELRLELAQEECDSEHLAEAADAHDRMESLIDDLLLLAHGREAPSEITSVDLAALVETCWKNVDTKAATLVTDATRTVRADESRLQRLFENLMRNAIEHGGSDVTVTIGDTEDGFYIADDGPGVPADDRTDVFDTGYSMSSDGTGFGLSIVEQVVETHGWDIRLTESVDGGARFEISGVETT